MTALVAYALALALFQAPAQTLKPGPPQPGSAPAAGALQPPPLVPQTAALPTDYRIGPADLLLVTVTDEAELTGKFLVDSDGMFSYPYLNRVRAAGMTSSELQQRLTSLLQAGYLRNPQVRVQIDSFRSQSVMVIGEVRQPGKIPMTSSSMTLLEALVLAGSATVQASNEIIVRHRGVDGKESEDVRVNRKELELGRNDIALRDGDIINVPSAEHFYMEGFVRTPGYYVLDPGMTVQQAIALAGGLNDRGSDRDIKAIRLVKGKMAEVSVRLDDKVQSNDTIRVRARFF
jgi:polysaccharide export outer membrane protein